MKTRSIWCKSPASRCAGRPRTGICRHQPRHPPIKRVLRRWAERRARSGINPTQRVGGRLFIMRDSTWTDLGHGDSLRVVTIAPYSDAYFALLKAVPDLREAAALEPAVLVAGRRASIKIETGGKTRWLPGELERLVRDFRS